MRERKFLSVTSILNPEASAINILINGQGKSWISPMFYKNVCQIQNPKSLDSCSDFFYQQAAKLTWNFSLLVEYRDPHFRGVLGKFGLLLEDVATLTSWPLFIDTRAIGATLEWEDKKRLNFLNKALSDSRNSTNKATYQS